MAGTRLRNEAISLRNRQEFQRSQLTELTNTDIEAWVKESYEIATKIYNEVRLRLVSLVLKKTTTLIERVLLVKGKIICRVGREESKPPTTRIHLRLRSFDPGGADRRSYSELFCYSPS